MQLSLVRLIDAVSKAVLSPQYLAASFQVNIILGSMLVAHSDLVVGGDAPPEVVRRIFDSATQLAQALHCSGSSEDAMRAQVWPLSAPGLLEAAGDLLIEPSELVDFFLHVLHPLCRTLVQEFDQSNWSAVAATMHKVHEVADPVGQLLIRYLCPALLDEPDTSPLGMKRVVYASRLLEKVDAAVAALTENAPVPWSLVWAAIELELAELDAPYFLLFRGSSGPETDSCWWNERPHSLSFEFSLFSGIRFDRTASVLDYCQRSCATYAIRVPLRDALACADSVFWVPPLPALLQISALGEMFHPRTKVLGAALLREKQQFVSGILQCPADKVPDFLLCDADPEPFVRKRLQDAIFLQAQAGLSTRDS